MSVAFLAYNRREELRVSLQKIRGELDYPAESLEVIVVDNASTDGTEEMVKQEFPDAVLVRNDSNVGVSGWNACLPRAHGEYVLMLDDDCYMTGDSLRRAVSGAREFGADLVSFRVTSSEAEGFFFNEDPVSGGERGAGRYATGLLAFWGCAALVRREAFAALGGYDPNIFVWANELDFTMRLFDRGLRHLYLAEVTAVHMKAPGDDEFALRPYRLNNRHWAYIAGKSLRPADAGVTLLSLASQVAIHTSRWDRSAARALIDLLEGFYRGVRTREPVRSEVSATYRRHFRTFAGPWPFFRSPRERLRGMVKSGTVGEDREERLKRWFEERRAFYPTSTAVLDLSRGGR